MSLCVINDNYDKIVLKNEEGSTITLFFQSNDNVETENIVMNNLMKSYEGRVENEFN